jgi:uncharacterized protein (TIGR02145 family)
MKHLLFSLAVVLTACSQLNAHSDTKQKVNIQNRKDSLDLALHIYKPLLKSQLSKEDKEKHTVLKKELERQIVGLGNQIKDLNRANEKEESLSKKHLVNNLDSLEFENDSGEEYVSKIVKSNKKNVPSKSKQDASNRDSLFESFEYFSFKNPDNPNQKICKAKYKKGLTPKGFKTGWVILLTSESDSKLLIDEVPRECYGKRVISAKHGLLNSKNEPLIDVHMFWDAHGKHYVMDSYFQIIPVNYEFVNKHRLSLPSYQPYDQLNVYKWNNKFYLYDSDATNEKKQLYGPYNSISPYNTNLTDVGKPSYKLHSLEGQSYHLKLEEKHWALCVDSERKVVKMGANGKQGLWDKDNNNWLIKPIFFLIHEFQGVYFCSHRKSLCYYGGIGVGNNDFDAYSSDGELLFRNVFNFTRWNNAWSFDQPVKGYNDDDLILINNSFGTKSLGILAKGEILINPMYSVIQMLPNHRFAGRMDKNSKDAYIWDYQGNVLWSSSTNYITYNNNTQEYILKSFKSNASENVNSSKDMSNLINVENEVIEKEEAPPTEVFGSLKIGTMTWMTRNLDVSTFQNGDPIQQVKNKEDAVRATKNNKPAWCYLNFDPANGQKYGKYYNWAAISDRRKLAPQGWLIPGKSTWENLKKYLEYPSTFIMHDGKKYVDQMHQEERVPNIGKAMKSKKGWSNWKTGGGNYSRTCSNCSNWNKEYRNKVACHNCKDTRTEWVSAGPVKYHSGNGTNTTGFNALPGGGFHQYTDKSFDGVGEYGIWWSDFSYKNEKTYSLRGLKGLQIYTFKLREKSDIPDSKIYSQDWDYDKQNEPITPYFNVRCFHY